MHYEIDFNRYSGSDVFGTVLPSVYVEKVDISSQAPTSEAGSETTTFEGTLVIYERRTPDSDSLWYTDDNLRQFMNIEVAFRYLIGESSTATTTTSTLDIIAESDLEKYYFATMGTVTIYKIPYEFTFQVEQGITTIRDAEITAQISIDTDQIQETYGFEYPSDLPTEGESSTKTVMEDARIVTAQQGLFTPEGKLWLGLTHEHTRPNGDVITMAGPKHTTESHPVLSTQTIPNYVRLMTAKETVATSIDMSLQSTVEELFNISQETNRSSYSNLISGDPATFSNQYLTRTNGSQIASFYSVDFEDLFLRNSKFATIYSYLAPSVRSSLIGSAGITSAFVYRFREDLEDIVPVSIDAPESIELTDAGLVRTYKIVDPNVLGGSYGVFHYRLELRIQDPMYDYLKRLFSRLSEMITDLEGYYSRSGLTINYDYLRDTFRMKYFEEVSAGTAFWTEAEDLFMSILNTFNFNLTQNEQQQLLRNMKSYLEPQTATLTSIESAVEIFQIIKSNLESLVNIEDYQNYFNSTNSSHPKSSTTAPANSIEIVHDFENFDVKDYGSYLEFVEVQDGQIQHNAYITQYATNAERYVTTLTAEPVSAQGSFFGVSSIQIGDSAFNTRGWDSSTYQELSAIYNLGGESLESGYTELEAMSTLAQIGIIIRDVPLEGIEQNSDPAFVSAGTVSVSAIMGAASKATPAQTPNLPNVQARFNSLSATSDNSGASLDLALMLPADNNQITYSDPSEVTSIFELFGGTNSQQSYSLLQPVLSGRGSPNAQTDSLAFDAAGKNLDSQLNKFIIYLKYIMMGRIEYLSDASYSSTGGVKSPLWTVMDSDTAINIGQTLLCRVRRVDSAGYSGQPIDFFNYNILNEYFILKG